MSSEQRASQIEAMSEMLDRDLQYGDALYHWAERLISELDWLNDRAAYDEANGQAGDAA